MSEVDHASNWDRLIFALELAVNSKINMELTTSQCKYLLDKLTSLTDRIADLEAERRWIPVSERLPEVGKNVLTYESGSAFTDCYSTVLMATHGKMDMTSPTGCPCHHHHRRTNDTRNLGTVPVGRLHAGVVNCGILADRMEGRMSEQYRCNNCGYVFDMSEMMCSECGNGRLKLLRWTKGGVGSHWEGCEEVHWDCRIAQLEKEIARLRAKFDTTDDVVEFWKGLEE